MTARAGAREDRIERRRASVPTIDYPAALPVSAARAELARAIAEHQVVIVAGETGSGKTTQLPKICLELGRGVLGMIGHTQPRRIAARTVAERIAEELHVSVGSAVGYAVRFTDKVGDDTLIKLMTDGILLTDIHRDRTLSAYDTLIIDEAHERSLNVDFILGYLKQLLPRRPDLKVIVTSATIDPERFSRHFDGAPVIEVSGRTFPVELRYRPPETDDQTQAISDAIDELRVEPPGDVLVFLSGEREIRDTAEALRGRNLPNTEILPLYARLPAADQHRVFAGHPGRRIVLATNVAETSLTVPGIRYVVDPGTARISRYSHRLKVQRLPIESISQASANQRSGRCGRLSDGICIRLYDEEDFDARPAFTEPEMLRTNLASVILQMAALDLGDIAAFPFVEPPDRRAITDGVRLLEELGALEPDRGDDTDPPAPGRSVGRRHRLTRIGRQLARLPVDPRFARMVIAANDNDCLREVLIITAGLSIEDPRERPADHAAHADQVHARFREDGSDFLSYLALWRYLREQQRVLSSNQFRRLCRAEHINYLRVREWQDVHSQLRKVASELGMRQHHADAEPDTVHRALLAGLLSHIGMKDRDTREYRGPRNARFAIFPGSVLAKKPPQWVMAAELVETSRLWARTVGRIEPPWVEALAPHLLKRSYGEPHWSAERGEAMAYESATLYGLPIVTRRLVGYGRIDPEHARELFIRHALVEGDWQGCHPFLRHNRELLTELEELEHRFRRSDLVADEDTLHRLYDERVDVSALSARHFDSWWKKMRRTQPDLLTFTVEQLLSDVVDDLDEADFPEVWNQGDLVFPLRYTYETGRAGDGVTVDIPLAVLNQVSETGFDWQVPGLREARVAALIRSLPKAIRRNLLPVADRARDVLQVIEPMREPLVDALARELGQIGGVPIRRDAWDLDRVPDHLSVTFAVIDDGGKVLAESKDLDALQQRLAPRVRATIAAATKGVEQRGLTTWSFGMLPRRIETSRGDGVVVGYPALVDEGDSVAIRVFDNEVARDEAHWAGVRRLLALAVSVSYRDLRDRLEGGARLALAASPYPDRATLIEDVVTGALDETMAAFGAPVVDGVAYDALLDQVQESLEARCRAAIDAVAEILVAAAEIDRRLDREYPVALIPALEDVAHQRAALVHDGFIVDSGTGRLVDIGRYLRGALARMEVLPAAPGRDRERMAQVHKVEMAYGRLIDATLGTGVEAELERIGWMIEELRMSLFAQQIGTPEPVSESRIMKAIAALRGI